MKTAVCVLILLAGPGDAQWRRFGQKPEAAGASTLPREMLAAHNAVRTGAGIPALTWSRELESTARNWANALMARRQFKHRPDTPYGENLFEITGDSASPGDVVNAWAAQARDYDYRSNSCRRVCGHYTQVIWSDTKQVGCGVARGRGREVWVCNYNPPGNVVGQRPY
ncbi:MAG TPA: CAP domain-containing protein [Bryobacteraceae bacterium]|nr:CAP domain-containing protein [Bryobacteraceae bacterium]